MRPLLYVLSFLAVLGLGFWAYRENYTTQSALRDVADLQDEIASLHESLAIQRAEWAYLNRPTRLRDLAAMNFDRLGLMPMVAGSLLCTLGAIALALPLGMASALFSQYYGHSSLVLPYRWLLGLLAGIPSVVYGFWGLTVLVPLIGSYQPPGASLLAGILILALMILPTVALTAEAAFKAVPVSYLQGAHALGMRKAAIAFKVLFPAARQGLMARVWPVFKGFYSQWLN